jgi:hypothetical protein
VYVDNCLLCGEVFHCNDIAVTSCGHCYHPFCLISHSSKSNSCIANFCDKEFDAQWRLSWGFPQPLTPVPTPDVTQGSPISGGLFGEISLLSFEIKLSSLLALFWVVSWFLIDLSFTSLLSR